MPRSTGPRGPGERPRRKRRAHHEGTLFQRASDGRWVAQMPPDPETGRRKTFIAASQEEARARLAKALHDRELGLPIVTERQTVAQYLTDWLEHVRPRIARNTYVNWEVAVRLHLIPALGHLALSQLTAQRVQRLYAALLADHAPQSVRVVHTALHVALEAAVRLGLVQRNVSDLVQKPRVPRREVLQVWTLDQSRRFLESVRGHPYEALYILALTTGMRQSELLGLTWRHVDLDAGRLRVLQQLQRRRDLASGFALAALKTATARRTIALAPVAVEALAERRIIQREHERAAGAAYQQHDLVFAAETGMPLHRSVTLLRFNQLVARVPGLPRITFHDLRHTAATLLLARKVNVKVVSEMLGHSSISMTLGVYAHLLPEMQEEATMAMEGMFAPARLPGATVDAVGVREVDGDE